MAFLVIDAFFADDLAQMNIDSYMSSCRAYAGFRRDHFSWLSLNPACCVKVSRDGHLIIWDDCI